MKIYVHSHGDDSVGIWPGDITIEIHGATEDFYDADELGIILQAAREFGEEVFSEKCDVITEEELKKREDLF